VIPHFEAQRYTQNLREEWEDFVGEADNGTLFHLQRFFDYHPEGRFDHHHLIFRRATKIFSLFPAALREGILSSHSGASYGGFVVKRGLGIREALGLVQGLLNYAQDQEIKGVRLTIPPIIYWKHPNNYLDFALLRNGFRYEKRELTSVIGLTYRSEEDILSTFRNETRTAVRKAKRSGVLVAESDDLDSFYEILKKNLWLRHNVTPTHSLAELILLKKLLPERIKLFSAFYQGKQIAGVVLFVCNAKVVLAFYISHNQDFQNLRAVNLLFYECLRWAWKEGFQWLDLGTFTLNMEPNLGLGRFKENFGAQGYFRDTLDWTLPNFREIPQ
jgi:hypothetical protein